MGKIVINNLGKAYKTYPSKLARMWEWLIPFIRPKHQLKWVIQNVSFTVNPGEAVGIIGINGAGKSTLLKMITGTTQPTIGSINISGRVAALLELGMGFHPDFTGRQNAYMAGQLLGLRVEEITQLMPEIEAFAEIDGYIDQPLRVYSSGMQVRLAFAVATAHRPDVLIVDEALSVGDAAFQRKCFQRIESYKLAGTTLLLVSHDIETVKKICDRALFIKKGELAHYDEAKLVCDEYEKYLFGGQRSITLKSSSVTEETETSVAKIDPALIASCEMVYGNGRADIESCWLADVDGHHINVIEAGRPFRWCYRVKFNEDINNPIFTMMLKTCEGVSIYGIDSIQLAVDEKIGFSSDTVDVQFSLANYLAPGLYYFNCGVRIETINGVEFLSRRVDAAILRVTARSSSTVTEGLVDLDAKLELKQIAVFEQ